MTNLCMERCAVLTYNYNTKKLDTTDIYSCTGQVVNTVFQQICDLFHIRLRWRRLARFFSLQHDQITGEACKNQLQEVVWTPTFGSGVVQLAAIPGRLKLFVPIEEVYDCQRFFLLCSPCILIENILTIVLCSRACLQRMFSEMD